jgi:hypothetical protein
MHQGEYVRYAVLQHAICSKPNANVFILVRVLCVKPCIIHVSLEVLPKRSIRELMIDLVQDIYYYSVARTQGFH